MIQGATSDAGKSTLVAGLCRVLHRQDVKVAPFKPQNMALNSAVTTDGGEIGRAQAVQARACGLEPHSDFNPILLKPNSDVGAQVIVHGKAITNMDAVVYHDYKKVAMQAVLQSHERLLEKFETVVVEGAGSPAEINLREGDIANMGFAEAVDCPVILIADIERGGVFAHLVGTLNLLSESEQNRIVGFVINRFRGDLALLEDGLDWLEERTGKPVLGVLPYLHDWHLESEDSIAVEQNSQDSEINIVVPVLPRMSNHTDFDTLRLHPQVNLQFVALTDELPPADLIVLPGTKNTRADLQMLRESGWDVKLQKHLRYGGKLIGICGGFQMLGQMIEDPKGLESSAGKSEGFGWFNMTTTIEEEKILTRKSAKLSWSGACVKGYEIHAGRSCVNESPALLIDGKPEGALSADNQIFGTYLHGLFDHAEAIHALLEWAGLKKVKSFDYDARQEQDIDRLADALEQYIDWNKLL